MAELKFTSALNRFFPGLKPVEVKGSSVREVIHEIDHHFPGLTDYILEEDGSLRHHVNIFLNQELIKDKTGLTDSVEPDHEILVFQALSGG